MSKASDVPGGAAPRRAGLLNAILEEEARLARLAAQSSDTRTRLATLQSELAALGAEPEVRVRHAIVAEAVLPRTPAEKVSLFRSLFRGRPDVFPTRFMSKKTGKSGYAPACANKFVRGVCALPAIRCGECPNQAFRPVDDRAVLDHLRGRHVMGVYPLLETRRAGSWRRTLTRPRGETTCPPSSRRVARLMCPSPSSGPAPATAPTSGSSLWLPSPRPRRGRWGAISSPKRWPVTTNSRWIRTTGSSPTRTPCRAAPLQHEARRHGNTLFVDEAFESYPDQWANSRRRVAWTLQRSSSSLGKRRRPVGWSACGLPTRRRTGTPNPGCGHLRGGLADQLSQARCPGKPARSSRSGCSWRRQDFPLRCLTKSSDSRRSKTQASTRSSACGFPRR